MMTELDIVQRITQRINAFPRSTMQLGAPCDVVMPAARVGDIINHTSFWSALAGAVVGACITAGIFALASVAVTAAVAAMSITGGLAAPIVAFGLGLGTTWAVSDGIEKITSAVTNFVDEAIGGEPSGPISKGADNVFVNDKPLAMVDLALSVACTRHSPEQKIAQGSETVFVHNKAVARKGDKTECSATIAEGSPNVFIGSGQATYLEMKSEFTGAQQALFFAVEFLVPPTALLSKGIGKGLTSLGKALATKGPRAGAALAAKMAGRAAKGIAKSATRKAQQATKLAKAAGRGMAKGAKAVGRGVAKGAKAVGSGIGKGVKQAGKIARGKTLGCAKCAFKENTGIKRFSEAVKKFFKGDPIDVLTGEVSEQRVDFTLGQTIPLSFIRTWARSKENDFADGLCGRYWVDNFSEYAEVSDNGQQINIATCEGTYLRFALPQGATGAVNPDHPDYTLIRHRDYLELFHRETQLAKLFYFSEVPQLNPDDEPSGTETNADADFTYPPLTDGRYLISAWLDTFDNAVQFHYNEHSWLEAVSHTDGILLTLSYQDEWLHQITRIDNGQQEVLVTYQQNEQGALVESDALLDFHLFYDYDDNFNLTRWADNDKTWVTYEYDPQGRVIHSIGAEGFYPVWFRYEEHRTTVLDSQQRATVYDYDSHLMKPLTITSPSGAKTQFKYDRYGNLLTQTFPDGKQVTFDYLEQTGLVTCFTDTAGNQWHYDYDENEQLCKLTDPLGRVWTKTEQRSVAKNSENPTACITLFTAPDGTKTEFVRNQYGLLTEVKSTFGKQQHAEHFHYDPRHRLVESQDAEQRRIQLSYDNQDRLTRFTNARGHQWQYGYTPQHKLTRIARPNQSEEKQQYDRHGNLIRYTDANGVDWQLNYGAFDLLIEKIDGEGNRWRYDYDKDSLHLSQVTNPKGETYRYTFNESGQVVEEIDFANHRWRYTYNDNGTLSTLTDGEGNVNHYEYDSANHLIRLMTADDTFVYHYDKVGRVTAIQSLQGELQFEYDLKDRIIKEVQNVGEIHRTYDDETQTLIRTLFLKDEQGQLNTTSPIITTFKYNAVGELIQLDLPAHASHNETNHHNTTGQKHGLFFQYDQNGNEIHRYSPQGFILNQRFDEMDCLIQQRAGWEPSAFFDKHELRATGIDAPSFAEVNQRYGYDKALNTIETKDKGEQRYFTLNKNNQITQVHNQNHEQERYGYDECGYLTQQAQGLSLGFGIKEEERHVRHQDIYQQGHQLNRLNDNHYRYDKAGRLTEKTEIRDGFRKQTTYFRWNANNQLTGITNNQGEVWYYQYDALGRRISKACPQQQLKITYLWDGDQLAYTQTVKQNKLVSQRHSVFHGWQLIAQQDRYQQSQQTLDGNKTEWKHETHYAITQPNGKVLGLLSPEGKLKWKDEKRSVWGLLFPNDYRKTSPLDPQFLFAGQYTDQESGLAYNRFRYYDPESGNYISSDPIGLNGGETPYRYVHNVLDFLDPFGLAGCAKYRQIYLKAFPRMKKFIGTGKLEVHHRIPQIFIGKGRLFPESMRTSLSNLQGLPRDIHRKIVTPAWEAFRKTDPNATRAEIVKFAMDMDKKIAEYINIIN
ncbi:RHS repeat-associated core domain-containing protein [Pasteurella sp. PK-2025]|uniref:RHS repeat-associated core domain-containing protein n=1 Tax=Pasteurella sp. PK-2025 TaxID=3413133 RepID=UPI003C74DD57